MKHKLAGEIAENAMIYGHTIHGTVPNVIVYFLCLRLRQCLTLYVHTVMINRILQIF